MATPNAPDLPPKNTKKIQLLEFTMARNYLVNKKNCARIVIAGLQYFSVEDICIETLYKNLTRKCNLTNAMIISLKPCLNIFH